MTTPNMETARLIREYAQWALDECFSESDPPPNLLLAIAKTPAGDDEACCHMGRAMLAIEQSYADPPYRLGGTMCDPRITEIARLLGFKP